MAIIRYTCNLTNQRTIRWIHAIKPGYQNWTRSKTTQSPEPNSSVLCTGRKEEASAIQHRLAGSSSMCISASICPHCAISRNSLFLPINHKPTDADARKKRGNILCFPAHLTTSCLPHPRPMHVRQHQIQINQLPSLIRQHSKLTHFIFFFTAKFCRQRSFLSFGWALHRPVRPNGAIELSHLLPPSNNTGYISIWLTKPLTRNYFMNM